MFSRFAAADLPCIRLSRAVVKAIQADQEKIIMEGFHSGNPELEKEDHAFLKICKSADHDEKMMFVVVHKKKSLLAFGRMGPTNFAKSPLMLVEGVPVSCSEQLFKLHCVSAHTGISDNCDEIAIKILSAIKPFQAKSATTKLTNFDKLMWDRKSMAAMYASILRICMEADTFARFKSYSDLIEGDLLVVEANDDRLWGINIFGKAFLMALLDKMTPESDLFESARDLFDGANQLGEVLTVFLNEIRDMSYEEFIKATAQVKFVEIVE